MTEREKIHRLVDGLPESELDAVERFVAFIYWRQDPLQAALEVAEEDDEPESPEEATAVAQARAESAQGRGIADEDVWRQLGA